MCNCIVVDFRLTGNRPSRAFKIGLRPANPWFALLLLYFLYLHQVLHFADHTQDLRSSFDFFGSMHLLEAKGLESQLLTLGTVDATLDLRDSDLCHENLFEPLRSPVTRLAAAEVVHRGWFLPKFTHPRCTVYDGPSAGEPVVRLSVENFL